jgi:4'-phosphopantetheinyl transferase
MRVLHYTSFVRLALGPPPLDDAVHVWRTALDDLPFPPAELERFLTPEELARANRYRVAQTRAQFVAVRGSLRVLLGHYLDEEPGRVPIGVAPDGKPTLGTKGLEFNVSHTSGLALFAVGARPVGVDVEALREVTNAAGLVGRFFAAAEREQYERLPEGVRAAGFFRGWTCKEAVLKGIGCGARDLDRCVVDLDPRGAPRIVGPAETAANWGVACWEPLPGYVAAVAAAGEGAVEIERAAPEGGPLR